MRHREILIFSYCFPSPEKIEKINELYDEGNIKDGDLELGMYVWRDMRISIVASSFLFPHEYRPSEAGEKRRSDEQISTLVEDETTENISGTEAQ